MPRRWPTGPRLRALAGSAHGRHRDTAARRRLLCALPTRTRGVLLLVQLESMTLRHVLQITA